MSLPRVPKSGQISPARKKQRSSPKPEDVYPLARLVEQTEALDLSFFERPATGLARDLVGCLLLHGETAGMIVETEAYLGLQDFAAHASRGRTARTQVLFGPPGRAYVYVSYGLHDCLNVVADTEGEPGCVLIRALAPLCGIAQMYQRRHWQGTVCGLANGPGKLTQALAITREQYGQRLDHGELTIRAWREKPVFSMGITPRIGITKCADWPLRFVWQGHPCLSKS